MKTKRRTAMKIRTKRLTAIIALTCIFAVSVAGAAISYADSNDYYVCFSNQNYAVRNSNKMQAAEDGEYILGNISLSSSIDFYITDSSGTRWYSADDEPISVEESAVYAYDIKFSPSKIYASEDSGWADTGCRITYRFFVPESRFVRINGESANLDYNPYNTAYELHYLSSVKLNAGDAVSYEGEEHIIASDGYYRILFTPDNTLYGSVYKFDENGNYGSGSDYKYNTYIEDAPRYFAVFKDGVNIYAAADSSIDGRDAYLLQRYEKNVSSPEYRTPQFFVGDRDTDVKYCVYEEGADGAIRLIDDDNDADTEISKLRAADAGWYTLSFTELTGSYMSVLSHEEKPFGGWYAVGEFNGYGFDNDGAADLDDVYRFAEVEEGDDDYEEDYKQYLLYFDVSERDLRDGDVEFYITDGKDKYKNGAGYIALNRAGRYKILFSQEHLYGRLNYRYVLEDGDKENTEISIGTAEEFIEFAENCSRSADYSVNLTVYLTRDIDFKDRTFVPVDSFSGKFMGQNHVLKNVTYADGAEYNAAFSVITRTGSVERLDVENVNLGGKDSNYVGIVGRNYGTVSNVTATGKMFGNEYVGGIVAYNGVSAVDGDSATVDSNDVVSKAVLKECISSVEVSGCRNVGGLCGYNSGEIYACRSDGGVKGVKNKTSSSVVNIGGIAGFSKGRIYDCENSAVLCGGDDSLYAGGIVGLCTGEIYFSFNRASVSASKYAGGICGYYGVIENNSDDLKNYFGGMDYETFIKNMFGDGGSDNENQNITGIIEYCANYGDITCTAYAGGIAGNVTANGLKILNCASTANVNVTAGSYAGGIAGNFSGAEITGCMSTGLIQAKGLGGGNYVGGVAGYGANIRYCMSAATIKGGDYVGGIAGYASDEIIGCYTNVLVSPASDAVNVGGIAGFAAAYNISLNSFGDKVKGNYYVAALEGINGIHGKDYASSYDYAAAEIASSVFATDGMLSYELSEHFSREYWQGGNGNVLYPTLCYFEKSDVCEEFGDDEKRDALFAKYAEGFKTLTEDGARLTFTVTFMEWNKDNGDLYDDGQLQTDNFDIISVVRVFAGQTAEIPQFVYAQPHANGGYVYKGSEARYFVSFPEVLSDSNAIVYAQYREIVNSVTDENNTVFAEGDFCKGTQVRLVRVGDYITFEFTLEGTEIFPEDITVKVLAGENADKFGVYEVNGEGTDKVANEVSGKYLQFGYSSGQFFLLEENTAAAMPFWAWLLIGIGSTAIVCGGAVLTVYLVKRKRNK